MKSIRVGWAVGVLFIGACTEFNVVPVAVEEVTVLPTQVTAEVDEQASFTTELRDATGDLLPGRPVEWSSTDSAVAVVDSLGMVTAMGPGQALILARVDGQVGTALMVVIEQPPVGPPPDAPSDLKVDQVGETRMYVRWRDRSDNESWFELERRRNKGQTWALVATPGVDAEEHLDTGLTPNTEYEYRIRACNPAGCSGYSNRDKDRTDD